MEEETVVLGKIARGTWLMREADDLPCCLGLFVGALVLLVTILGTAANGADAEGWQAWVEAEDYVAQRGSQAKFYSMGQTASAERIVDNDWGRDPGDFLQYDVEVPVDCESLHVTFRFARAMSSGASIRLTLADHAVDVQFPSTAGWGFRPEQWWHGQVRLGRVKAGKYVLRLEATAANSNLNTDGFYLSDRPVSVPGETVRLEDVAGRQRQRDARAADLAAEARRLPEIACIVQPRLGNPNGMVRYHAWPGRVVLGWGCRIEVFNPARPDEPPRVLFRDPNGALFDLNVSYDARTLFFSHRSRDEENWHIWAISTDGTGLRQLTDGPYTDFAPEELPDGRLVFCSTRIRAFNVCAQTLSTALFTMNRDGGDMRQLTVNTLNDYSPHVLSNGQILYTRWEYVDRDVKWRQSLWTVHPDGSKMRLFFGNTIQNPAVFWQARPMPGTDRVAATFAPHHGWPLGAIGTVTRRHGPEAPAAVGYDWITREYPAIFDNGSLTEWAYRDPFPLDDRLLLVSYGGGLKEEPNKRFRICLLDVSDVQVTLHEAEEPTLSCLYPVPLMPRPRPSVMARGDVQAGTSDRTTEGTFLLVDVHEGLRGFVEPGEIKYLRILEQPAKWPINESSPRAFQMTPVMGRRCYYRKRCLGVVPVEADGSAHFRVPAFRELYFQALDGDGRAVQSMGSAVSLVSGERQSCIGCHEGRTHAAASRGAKPLAARKPPVAPRPYEWGNGGNIAFPVVVQPVLDRHCTECHGGTAPAERLDLTGDRTRFFSVAYDAIWDRGLIWSVELTRNDGQVIPPKAAWSFASGLTKYLEPSHHDVQLDRDEKERIHLWLDTNGNYHDTHARTRPGTIGGRDCWQGTWFDRDLVPMFATHCAECHGPLEKRRTDGNVKMAWLNLQRPENSLLLNAHLARSAGGLELLGDDPTKHPPVWRSTTDPIHRAMLEALQAGCEALEANPRIDMPGAQPRPGQNDWATYPGTIGADAPIPEKFSPDETP